MSVTLTILAHGLVDGDLVDISDILWSEGGDDLNGLRFTVSNATTNTFDLEGISGDSFSGYISGGTVRKAVTVLSGYDHLEGETVRVLANGYILPDCVVTGGTITLQSAASVVQAGLGYTHRAKTLKLEAGTAAGTAIGKTGQIFGITFCVVDSLTLTFGPDEDNLTTVDFRAVADAMDYAVPLFTGEYFAEFDDDWKTDSRIFIVSDDPAPFMLAALAPEIDKKDFKA